MNFLADISYAIELRGKEKYLIDGPFTMNLWTAREVVEGFEKALSPLKQRRHSILEK